MIESGFSCPSYDALLERGVELREGHRDRRRPQGFEHCPGGWRTQPNLTGSPAMSSGFTIGLLLFVKFSGSVLRRKPAPESRVPSGAR